MMKNSKKWRKALLESILWDVRTNLGNIYVNGCDTKIIQKYLKTMQPAIRALEEFQANIRKEQRIRHDKKTYRFMGPGDENCIWTA